MHYLTLRSAVAVMLGLLATASAHAQATINDCEKIQAADAYNQCLAKFGPTSKVHSLEPERPGDIKSSSEEASAGAGSRKGGGASHGAGRHHRGHAAGHRRASGSRKHMTISVGRRRHH